MGWREDMIMQRTLDDVHKKQEGRKRVNISVTEDTVVRLKKYAADHHTTVSQAITDWIWSEKL